MLRILIVDDEKTILYGICRMINKDYERDFQVDIVMANNVMQAIEALDVSVPDLILTDIKMPVRDGFDLIRHVRENDISTTIVVLTGYAEFEYAQQAIQLGVMDYITKPIDQNHVRNIIRKVHKMKETKEQREFALVMNNLKNIMLYNVSDDDLFGNSDLIREVFPHTYFTVVVLALPQVQNTYQKVFEQVLLHYYSCCGTFYCKNGNQLVGVCNSEKIIVKSEKIVQELINTIKEEVYVGISVSSSDCDCLHNLYINALQRIWVTQNNDENYLLTEIALFSYQECINIYQEKDEDIRRYMVRKYLVRLKKMFGLKNEMELVYRSFFQNILMYLHHNNISISYRGFEINSQILDWDELANRIINQLEQLKSEIKEEIEYGGHENDVLINGMVSYIQQNYQKDISLEDLAEDVGIHPNYACLLFRKRVGQSYLSFLHKERITVAKQLMKKTDNSMERIAMEVGYNSASQFSRVFRKYEGITPSTYRSKKICKIGMQDNPEKT